MKTYIFTFLIIGFAFVLQGQSAIIHVEFENDWVIPDGANEPIDIDEDGVIDLYVNAETSLIGFTLVDGVSRIASTAGGFLGTQVRVFEEGELIEMTLDNYSEYLDDHSIIYSTSLGNVADWPHNEYGYVGLALSSPTGIAAKNAWINIFIDDLGDKLIIKEWAYRTEYALGEDGIEAGDTGELSSVEDIINIKNINISPNPASDRITVKYDYSGQEQLSLTVLNTLGQEISHTQLNFGNTDMTIHTQDWSDGYYMLRFNTTQWSVTEQILISK